MNKRIDSSVAGDRPGTASASRPATVWSAQHGDAPPLHVITLTSSPAPIPLKAPKAPELAGLAVFRSRQVEDGRERFRLHIGYFPTAEAAEQVMPIVRRTHPGAIVAVAPQSSMGSLDDTAMARFSILRPVEAAPADPAPSACFEPSTAPAMDIPLATPPPPEVRRPVVATPPVLAREQAVAPPAVKELKPAATEAQHYAVQLLWSRDPIDLSRIPVLAIYAGYLLYAVETDPNPRRYFGVRLGFYADALSARLVAQYVRSEFKEVAVVPVSAREMKRASTAAIRLGSARSSREASNSRIRWPASALPVDPTGLAKAFTPATV